MKWNSKVESTTTETSITMLLLTVKTPNENPSLNDVVVVQHPKYQRYIWNIHWDKIENKSQTMHFLYPR